MRLVLLVLALFSLVMVQTKVKAEPNKEKPWQVGEKTVKEKMAKQFSNKKSTDRWTLEEYKDLDQFLEFNSTRRQFSYAIDNGHDFPEFLAYGMMLKGKGQYSIDLNKHPRWITIDKLFNHFNPMNPENWQYFQEKLTSMGFRPQDLATLHEYINNRDTKAEYLEAEKAITVNYAPRIRENYLAKIDNTSLLYQWNQELTLKLQRIDRDWAVDLLNQFDKQRQRILIEDALEHVRKQTIQATNPFSEQVVLLEGLFVNEGAKFFNY